MVIFNKEIRKNTKSLSIWTAFIAGTMLICVMLYPEMRNQMAGLSDMFADMGAFTQAFGMDQLNFGTLIGYYGIECGNVLGLGGGLFAAYLGITVLSKEEKDHTAEFLLSHPVKRSSVVAQKLAATICQILALNIIVFAVSAASIIAIGEDIPMKELLLLHGGYLILQLEITTICFGLSAFLRRGSIGIGLGGAALLYFMNIIVNLSEGAEFLKYVTPFVYAEPSTVMENMSLDMVLVGIGVLYSIIFVAIGFIHYGRKDIAA